VGCKKGDTGMGKKSLTAHFYSIEKMVGAELELLPKSELDSALKAVSELKVDRNEEPGRYYKDSAEDERCLMFQADFPEIPSPARSAYIPGLFIKRRTFNYPYENNDTGNLFQISLSDEDNELAEVTFFVIDTSLRVLMFISNPYVGAISSLEAYFNNRLKEYHESVSPLPFLIDEGFVKLDFPPIVNETPEKDFNAMADISVLEMHIAGSLNLLENTFRSSSDDSGAALEKVAQLAKKTRSKTIKIMFSSAHMKEKMNKSEIYKVFKKMRLFFRQSGQNNKFIVKGRIDDEVRVLDLLNADYFHKTSFDYDGRYVPIKEVFKRLYPIMDRYRAVFIKTNKFEEDNK
jgi:hypothetical protein